LFAALKSTVEKGLRADAVNRNERQAELPKIYLENAKKLQAMSKKGPPHLKLFALIAKKAGIAKPSAVSTTPITAKTV
jgi:hypothetical protein